MVGQKGRQPRPANGIMMSRAILFIVLLVLLIGGIVLLSNSAREVPAKPVEVEVSRDSSS
jgi:hypothetical protein